MEKEKRGKTVRKPGYAPPVVGRTLYSLNIGNEARGGRDQVLVPVTVTKVGRKYFTCAFDNGAERTYHLESFIEKSEYAPGSRLYENPAQWDDEREAEALEKELRSLFNGFSTGLSVDALREIKAAVDRDRSE